MSALKDPINHNLEDIFRELKFGRSAESQKFLDKCIEKLTQTEVYCITLISNGNFKILSVHDSEEKAIIEEENISKQGPPNGIIRILKSKLKQ